MPNAHDSAPAHDSVVPADPEQTEKQRQREAAVAWLEEKWLAPQVCPICTSTAFTVTEMAELRAFAGGGLVIGGSSNLWPVFQVVCNNCGYTMLFNAIMAGVIGDPGQADSSDPE